MFRFYIILISIISISISLSAQTKEETEVDQYIRVRPFSEGQLVRYQSMIKQIGVIQKKIESYYDYLVNNSKSDCTLFHGGEKIYCDFYKIQKNGMTYIPLNARKETIYGQKQRYVYNELAYFKWENKKISKFFFETRRGYVGTTRVLSRLFYGNTIAGDNAQADQKKPPMGLIINEVLPTGKGTFAQFAFATEDKVYDKHKEKLEINGKEMVLDTIYLRDSAERLNIVTKYLALLKQLESRLHWNVHASNFRKESQLQRVLLDSLD